MGKLRPRGRSLQDHNFRVPRGPHFTSSTLSPTSLGGRQSIRGLFCNSLRLQSPPQGGLAGSRSGERWGLGSWAGCSLQTWEAQLGQCPHQWGGESLWAGRLILTTTTKTRSKGTPALRQAPVKPFHALPIFSPSRQMSAFLPSRWGRRAFLLLAGTANGTGRGWGHRAGDV